MDRRARPGRGDCFFGGSCKGTLELGLSELFEIGFWADVLHLQLDFKGHFHTRLGTGRALRRRAKKAFKLSSAYFAFRLLALIMFVDYAG